MEIEVNKIGGGVLENSKAIRRLPGIIKYHMSNPNIIVISGFGKSTNWLESLVEDFLTEENKLQDFMLFFSVLALDLSPKNHEIFHEIDDIAERISKKLKEFKNSSEEKLKDQILPFAEFLSSKIISLYLTEHGLDNKFIDITSFIITDDNFGNAKVCGETEIAMKNILTENFVKKNPLIITQGFIGKTTIGNDIFLTTLGREGSDLTAVLIASILKASKITLWKDVDGIYDKNPKKNKNAELLEKISYDECEKLLETSAKGLVHMEALKEAKKGGRPLFIRNFFHPERLGSVIH